MSWSVPLIDPHARLVDDLLPYMTLEERLGQMRVLDLEPRDRTQDGALGPETYELVRKGAVSAIRGVRDVAEARALQRMATEQSRFGVPLLFEGLQGTVRWPEARSYRASWAPSLLQDLGRAVASRAGLKGDTLTTIPLNAIRDASTRNVRSDRLALLDRRFLTDLKLGLEGSGPDGVLPVVESAWPDGSTPAEQDLPGLLTAYTSESSDPRSHPAKRNWTYLVAPRSMREPPRTQAPYSEIDHSVRRILIAKSRLGLFRDPYSRLEEIASATATSSPTIEEAMNRLWAASVVLLRNEKSVLPLTRDAEDILVVGTHASSASYCNRALAAFGISYRSVSGLAMRPEGEPGRDRALPSDGLAIGMACDAAQRARTVLLVIDDEDCDPIPGAPVAALKGPAQTLLRALARDHRRIVLISASRFPVVLGDLAQRVASRLHVWAWPHQRSSDGDALFGELLTGETPPSGRLPFTIPAVTGSRGRPAGFGRTYGALTMSAPQLERAATGLALTARLANSGEFPGAASVQLYVQSPGKQSAQSRLKAFRTVVLQPHSQQDVRFELGIQEFGTIADDGHWKAEPGVYRVGIGSNSTDLLSLDIDLTAATLRALATDTPVDPDILREA